MKKLFYIAMALFAAVGINTSCGVNGEDTNVLVSIATVIDGTSSIPYYVVFDDGKEAYVTNTNEWTPSFSETKTELRYVLAYEVVNETSSIFDMEIKVVEATPINTQSSLIFASGENYTSDNGWQTYTSGATISTCFFSPARDYITLVVLFYGSYTYTGIPKMYLVRSNDIENSPYKDLYTADDGYYYLELYHNDSDYVGSQQLSTYLSCKMPDVEAIKAQYNGLKILAMSHSSNRPEVYTFNFTTEE